jgi:SET domain
MSKRKKQPTKKLKPTLAPNPSLKDYIEYVNDTEPDDANVVARLNEYVVFHARDIENTIPVINKIQSNLEIKPSIITAAGNGLFALKPYVNGEEITRYGGIEMSHNFYQSNANLISQGLDRYVVEIQRPDNSILYIDGRTCFKLGLELGRWINHNSVAPNCRFGMLNNKIIIVAVQSIDAGDELFLNYGNNYWTAQELQECITCGISNISILCRECGGPMCTRCSDEIHK